MKQEIKLTERQALWTGATARVLASTLDYGIVRQLRGPLRWTYGAVALAAALETLRRVGRVVGHELALHQFDKADAALATELKQTLNDQAAADLSERWAELPTDDDVDTPPRSAEGADFLLTWPRGWQGPV